MEWITGEFRAAHRTGSGSALSQTLLPPVQSPNVAALDSFYRANLRDSVTETLYHKLRGNGQDRLEISKAELASWAEVYAAFWTFLGHALMTDSNAGVEKLRYESWKEMTNAIIKGFSSGGFESWTLPCLYVASRWLRTLAIRADQEEHKLGKTVTLTALDNDDVFTIAAKNDNLEDAARVINRMFTLCITDRAAMVESRKWGLYYITNLLFKTYFKLRSVSLCKNPWRALQATHLDMPPLEAFPKAHICTHKYYVGLMFFLEEDYVTAESSLSQAYQLCHRSSRHNIELILTYLIPCRLMTSRELPAAKMLSPFPRLRHLFIPICKAVQHGNLAGFDEALSAGEREFVKSRVYLTLERGRDICLRNLFRKVFIAGGFENAANQDKIRRTRIPVDEFVVAVRFSAAKYEPMERDEVECLLSNMIFKGLMKGYIARERGIVVLSKGNAFPGTGM